MSRFSRITLDGGHEHVFADDRGRARVFNDVLRLGAGEAEVERHGDDTGLGGPPRIISAHSMRLWARMATRSPLARPIPVSALAARQARWFHCRNVMARVRSRQPVRSGWRRAWAVSTWPIFRGSVIIIAVRIRWFRGSCRQASGRHGWHVRASIRRSADRHHRGLPR